MTAHGHGRPAKDEPSYLLVRADDHVLLGLAWSGMALVDGAAGRVLVAGEDARLVLTFPPQHLAEEASPAGTAAPLSLSTPAGDPVPVWRALLSGASRVTFDLTAGTRIIPTVQGILEVLSQPRRSRVSPDETAVELPWRLRLAPRSAIEDGAVGSVHPDRLVPTEDVTGLWRSRLVTVAPLNDPGEPVIDPAVDIVAVDAELTAAPDPSEYTIPLERGDRMSIFTESSRRPARARRLELSSLGGTLVAKGDWDNYLWEHHAVLGRDMWVRTLAKGVLYPFGHRAEYEQFTERRFDPDADGAAVLRRLDVLTVTQPIRQPPTDGPARRAFPFDQVEITTQSYPDLQPADPQYYEIPGAERTFTHFWPTNRYGRLVRFPIRCTTADGNVTFNVPLIFVKDLLPTFASLTDPGLAAQLSTDYDTVTVPLPGKPVDLVRSAGRRDGDVHEVHSITIGGSLHASGYRPRLSSMDVALPALRSLLDDHEYRPVQFSTRFLDYGETEDVLLELTGESIDISFVGQADRSGGLVAPHVVANGISRTLGPVNRQALPNPATGTIDPASLFPTDATLLGFRLRDLVTGLEVPPQITSIPRPSGPPEVQMRWSDVPLTPKHPPFEATSQSRLHLTVTQTATTTETTCTITGFSLRLPVTNPLLLLRFTGLEFTQRRGQPPLVRVGDVTAEFLGDLELLKKLERHVGLAGLDPYLDVTATGITARYSLPLPTMPAGAFVIRNAVLSAAIAVPFDERPVTVSLAFASRASPFALTVLMFGGGGYIEITLDHTGVRRFELSLEFGALAEVDFLVARAEVHALGGVRFVLDERDGSITVTGYLRLGGCVEILGLVSVSVELNVELSYQTATQALVGRATLVIEIDLWLWSTSVELDTGEWVLAGGRAGSGEPAAPVVAGAPVAAPVAPAGSDDGLARWREYLSAFVPDRVGQPS